MGSTIGRLFTASTFGESHGAAVGAIVDGCPPGVGVAESGIQRQLDRRRPGQTDLSSPRAEKDRVRILSGLQDGVTLGTPIGLLVENRDTRPGDYEALLNVPRPSHADYTYRAKFGLNARSGGGRASARETVGRVAAAGVAEAFLQQRYQVRIVAWVSRVGEVDAPELDPERVDRAQVDREAVRCPDAQTAGRMSELIRAVAEAGDSVGGIVSCAVCGVPAGWGEPVFGKAEAALAGAMLSIPACKGFDIGSGFAGTRMRGSRHNDPFTCEDSAAPGPGGCPVALGTASNRSGGIQGGITNGQPIVFRVAFKPVATIQQPQQTVDYDGNPVTLEVGQGRHDPCVLPRAVPVVESMAALVVADLALLARAFNAS